MYGNSVTATLIDENEFNCLEPGSSELKRQERNFDADSYNNNGIWYMRECEYKKAFEEFEKSYKLCSDDYSHRHAFKNNMKLAYAEALNLEGDELLRIKKFSKSIKKYSSAIDKCPNKTTSLKFEEKVKKAKNAWAEEISSEGIELYNKHDYSGAAHKFQQALKKCNDDYSNKQSFEDNLLEVQSKITKLKESCLIKKKK